MAGKNTYAVIGGVVAAAVVIGAIAAFYGLNTAEQQPVETMEEVETMQVNKIKIFASFYPYYEFARNVAGDKATVVQYIPAGVEAHDWEPRPGDIQLLRDTDVFVYNGLGMDSYIDQIIDSGEYEHIAYIKAAEGVPLLKPIDNTIGSTSEHGHDDEHGDEHDDDKHERDEHGDEHDDDKHERDEHGDEHDDDKHDGHGHHGHDHSFEYDPHIWLDPILTKQQINNIKNTLVQVDPVNAEFYEQNAASFNAELDSYDARVKSELSNCERDSIVTFHNAFTYFGERYDINTFSIGGLAPDSEASAAEIATFVDFVIDNDIKTIFAEELVDTRLAEVVADEAGVQTKILYTIEALTPEEASANVTYMDKMEQNLESLKVALDCQ